MHCHDTCGTTEVFKWIMLLFIFQGFPKNVSNMFRKLLVTIDPLNNEMSLREKTTYMKVFIFKGDI